jgi:hypothetical protein
MIKMMFGFADDLFARCRLLPSHPQALKDNVPQLTALMKLRRLISLI